jgi:predicted transcriptional regulator of viral defense system
MARSRIQIARADILEYFDKHPQKVFKLTELQTILFTQRAFWRLAQSTTTQKFISYLIENATMRLMHFPLPHRAETRYTWGEVPLIEVVLNLKPNSYFSHYTAMRLHGLSEQVPKVIYLNHEQHLKSQTTGGLEQGRIDAAFKNKPRLSNNVTTIGDTGICLINGKNTGSLGVVSEKLQYDSEIPVNVRVTNLERTLIDIVTRPVYAGGVFEVLKAYELAKDQVSVNSLTAMLGKIQHTYPYHQAIGFYMERAGYKERAISLLRKIPMEFDFYLTNAMGTTEYIKEWKLFVPKGF